MIAEDSCEIAAGKGEPKSFHWAAEIEHEVLGERAATSPHHQLGDLGSAVSSQRRSGRSSDLTKFFYYFQHSGHYNILNIVDSHAAIGCKTPRLPAYNIHGCRPVLHISFSMEQAKCPILA